MRCGAKRGRNIPVLTAFAVNISQGSRVTRTDSLSGVVFRFLAIERAFFFY